MSKCIYCGKQTEVSLRGFAKKYCSDICGQRYRYWKKTGKRISSDYVTGTKTKEKEEKTRKMQEKYKWYCENWVSIRTLIKEMNVERERIFYISKMLEIKHEVIRTCIKGRRDESFFNPKDADRIRIGLIETPIPDGYVDNKQAADYLGCALNTFNARDKSNLPFKEFFPKPWAKKHSIKIYRPEDLEEWERNRVRDRALEIQENKKLREAAAQKKKAEKAKLKEERIKCETFGLIDSKTACEMLGIKSLGSHRKSLSVKIVKNHQPRCWYCPKEVKELSIKLEELRNRERKKQYPTRVIPHTAPEAYETRLIEKKFPLWQSDASKHDSIALNKKWHNNRINLGLIKKLHCGICNQDLPYYNFTYKTDPRGRQPHCRECVKQKHVNTYDPGHQKQLRKKNYVQKFRSITAGTIKRDMSKVVGTYQDLMTEEIWQHIEKTLGYDADGLCQHLESLFDDNMTWDNHLKSTKGFRWEMDHIIPRSELKYDSLSHPNFAKCWALSNLRPLEHMENKLRNR